MEMDASATPRMEDAFSLWKFVQGEVIVVITQGK